MFIHNDLIKYEKDLDNLGITDKKTMLGTLNTLDEMAEITYYIFKNEEKHDKEN